MQIRSSKNSCMGKENRLYSISLGVASLQGGLVGVATALSPATCRPFQVFSPSFFVGLGLRAGRGSRCQRGGARATGTIQATYKAGGTTCVQKNLALTLKGKRLNQEAPRTT